MSTLTANGKRITVEADRGIPDQYRHVAADTAAALSEMLTAAGAHVIAAADGPDLLLRFSPGALPSWGVAAVYSWEDWEEHRNLCAGLTEELSQAFGMPDLGARMSLTGGRQSGVPAVEVAIGRPAPGAADPLLDPAFPDQAAEALCRGLCRFWAEPAPIEADLPIKAPEAPPPTTEKCHCEAEPLPNADTEIERIVLDTVTITSQAPRQAPPPPPEDPIPQSEDPVAEPEPQPQAPPPKQPHFSHLVQTFFAPAAPRRPAPRDTPLISQHSAALVHIQSKAKKNHPR